MNAGFPVGAVVVAPADRPLAMFLGHQGKIRGIKNLHGSVSKVNSQGAGCRLTWRKSINVFSLLSNKREH